MTDEQASITDNKRYCQRRNRVRRDRCRAVVAIQRQKVADVVGNESVEQRQRRLAG